MPVEPDSALHHRRSLRLKEYDYAQAGAYFITICMKNRECMFGDVLDGDMVLNEYGIAVREEWLRTALLRDSVAMDAFVIMPNHLHGIIVINGSRGTVLPIREGCPYGRTFRPTDRWFHPNHHACLQIRLRQTY